MAVDLHCDVSDPLVAAARAVVVSKATILALRWHSMEKLRGSADKLNLSVDVHVMLSGYTVAPTHHFLFRDTKLFPTPTLLEYTAPVRF